MRKKRVGILISGGGSNLQALIDAAQSEGFPAQIALVLSNNKEAYGLKRAQKAGIETMVVNHRHYDTREDFDHAMHKILRAKECELLCLAGFMRILSEGFVQKWAGKMLNIHPSLLPKYRGLHTHARALAAGETEAGCTVHWVVPELDAGPIIAQASVPIFPEDTPEILAARVLEQEHRLYPEALRKAALGKR